MKHKKLLLALALLVSTSIGAIRIRAQVLPYQLTVAWDNDVDAATYNCYLDNVFIVNTSLLTCTIPVTSLGSHVVAVSAVNPAFVPNESAGTTLSFKLQAPSKPTNLKVK